MSIVMLIGDGLLLTNPLNIPRVYWVLLDPIVHALLALIVTSPLLSHKEIAAQPIRWLLIAGLAAILIDLDHFVAAHSFSINDALHLPARPAIHSLLFALVCALGVYAFTKNALIGWLLFLALLSHILRDAVWGGVPFFWPLPITLELSVPAYYAAQICLCLLAAFIAGWPHLPLWSDTLWQSSLKYLGNRIS